jgi:hypothetical protein
MSEKMPIFTYNLKAMIMTKCERCGEVAGTHTWSQFNTDLICIPCQGKEKQHPDYERAREAELAAIRRGNWNFEGIGKPQDL